MGTKKKILISLISVILVTLTTITLEKYAVVSDLRNKLLEIKDNNGDHYVRFLALDNNDSVLIKSKDKTAIIDFGGVEDGGANLIKAINKYHINKIDYAFVTTPDDSHIGGFIALSKELDINLVVIPKATDFTYQSTKTTQEVVEKIITGIPYKIANQGDVYKIGEFSIEILSYSDIYDDLEDRSVAYKIEGFNKSFLIAGALGLNLQQEILMTHKNMKIDVLKLPGYSNVENWDFIFFRKLKAEYFVSSTGYNNDYILQKDYELFNTLLKAKLYRTDINGDIAFYFNNNEMKVICEK